MLPRRLPRFVRAASLLLLLTHLLAAHLSAQGVDARLYEALRWRMIGPFRGGRVLAVTGVRGQPDVFYFGAVGGGVWKTDDAGRTWKPIFDSQPVASIGTIAVAPPDPNVIYVGSGEADMRSDISYGNGMYRSADGGKTWAHIGLSDTRHIGRILVDRSDPNLVYVAALGHAYGPNAERGVFRSRDAGKSWERVLFRDENTGAIDLAFDPGDSRTIYAALWQTRRPPWSIYPPSNGPGSGLYRSTDGGDHWTRLEGHGLPSEGLGRMGIGVAPSNRRRIYLIVDAKEGGLYRSDDAGETWKRVAQEQRIWQRGWYFAEVRADAKNADTVYVSNTSLYRSQDGGQTFTAIKGAPGGDDYHGIWIDPDEPRRMIVGSDQGAIVTLNGGETWSSWYNQPTGQFYHVVTDNRFPYWVYGAQQDSGPAGTPSRSIYRALNFHDWRPIAVGDENGYIATDPLNPDIIYGGFVARQQLGANQVAQIPPTLAHPGTYRRTWTLPLVVSPRPPAAAGQPPVLYFGSQVLFRTADGGQTWHVISPDLTREDPGVPPNLDGPAAADAPASKRRGVIYTIAASPVRDGEIWIGTDDGLIQVTRNEGKSWENVTPPEITPWSKVTHLEASRHGADTVYTAVDRHRLDDYRPLLYRTRDGGKAWQAISRGIPEGSFLNCIREDPLRAGLLYACTETSVCVSFDGGDNWQSLELNLPTVSVRDLVVHGDDLVIATHGRSFWMLDNVTPLRQIEEARTAKEALLFRPQIAYRVRPGSDQGTPVPFDEPLAENPPDGAILDYYLGQESSGPATIEILDGSGKLVRRYSSDDKPQKVDPNSLEIPMYWVRTEEPLKAAGGMHRFVWDLHYAAPPGMSRSRGAAPRGVLAPPGEYMVKLTVSGKSYTQPLEVRMDPNVKVSQQELEEQFAAASELAGELSRVAGAAQEVEGLRKAVAAASGKATGEAKLVAALDELDAKTRTLLGSERGAFFGLFGLAPPSGEVSLRDLLRALNSLFTIVEGADATPTPDARAAIAKYEAAVEQALARWAKVKRSDVARVNELLRQARLETLPAGASP